MPEWMSVVAIKLENIAQSVFSIILHDSFSLVILALKSLMYYADDLQYHPYEKMAINMPLLKFVCLLIIMKLKL